MSRAKPSKGGDWFWFVPFELSDKVRVELVDILELDDDAREVNRMIDAVQRAIGEYQGRESTVGEPRPAHIIAAIQPVGDLAEKLTAAICDLDAKSQRLLFRNGLYLEFGIGPPIKDPVDERYFLECLSSIYANVKITEKTLESIESRGGDRKISRLALIHQLCQIFDRFVSVELSEDREISHDDSNGRIRKEPPLNPNRLKMDFVRAALDAAKIVYPKGENLLRLFPSVK